MRVNMDPLTPATMTLEESVGRIARMAREIVGTTQDNKRMGSKSQEDSESPSMGEKKRRQQATVRWVLAAPERLKSLQDGGKQEEAAEDWQEIKTLLKKWKGVKGVREIEEQCEKIMER